MGSSIWPGVFSSHSAQGTHSFDASMIHVFNISGVPYCDVG